MDLVAYGSKDLKLPKSKVIMNLREKFSEQTLNFKLSGKSLS